MPSPLAILLDPVSLTIIGIYAILMIWEAVFPARKLPQVKFWILRGMGSFAVFFFLSSYLPLLTDPYLSAYQLVDLSTLGLIPQALIGILLYEGALYVWHYSMHRSHVLWRVFHQMHHSAERMDTIGAFYFSPMDMVAFTLMGSVCFALLIGLSPQAITVLLLVTNFFSIFQHANIKTPHWLGYLVQRPESHTVHHAKGVHRYNYSDLPVYDIIFGTFNNPKNYEHETGFYNGASSRIWDMMLFRDVATAKKKRKRKSRKVVPAT